MATAQMTRNIVSSVAIPSRIATEQQSLALIKKLLAVSVSCITYLRGLFPEYAYGTRYLEDICVKILREDKSCPGSTQLVKWMLGCYDALQKKYLRMVVLAIYTNPEDPKTITECYQFKFKYTSSGPVMDFTSGKGESAVSACSDIKKASVLLIRKLYILMQNLGHLPNDVFLTMNLFYYDEVTPPEYQPPGFKEASCDGMMFEGEPMHLNVGGVTTPYHVLKVKVTTEKDRMEIAEEALLRKGEDDLPSHVVQMDSADAENTDQPVNGETASLNGEKQNVESMDTQEVNLDYKGAENAESDQNEEPQIKRQNPRSESTGLKTRSGKVFSSQIEEASSKTVQPAFAKSKAGHQATKQRRPFEIPMSQEESSTPKRRKYSEPKELY